MYGAWSGGDVLLPHFASKPSDPRVLADRNPYEQLTRQEFHFALES